MASAHIGAALTNQRAVPLLLSLCERRATKGGRGWRVSQRALQTKLRAQTSERCSKFHRPCIKASVRKPSSPSPCQCRAQAASSSNPDDATPESEPEPSPPSSPSAPAWLTRWLPPSSLPGSLSGQSYYPKGFEPRDKGGKRVTWQSGLLLFAGLSLLLLQWQWLASEVFFTVFGIAWGILGLLALPPLLLSFLGMHLLTKLPAKFLDPIITGVTHVAMSATAAADMASALLDIMPLPPVVSSLAAASLVLSLHESLNRTTAKRTDLALWVASLASLGYAFALLSPGQLALALGGAIVLSFLGQVRAVKRLVEAVRGRVDGDALMEKAAQEGRPKPVSEATQSLPDPPPLPHLILSAVTPFAASWVALGPSLAFRVGVLLLYILGALGVAYMDSNKTEALTASDFLKQLPSRIAPYAVFTRDSFSPFFLLKATISFVLLVAARRLAFVFYMKAHGL